MNTTKSVYNKLFSEDKVELGKHEVQLGLVDNAKAMLSVMADQMREQDALVKQYNSLINPIKSNMTGIEQSAQKLNEMADKIIKMENELGISGNGKEFKDYAKNALDNSKKQYPLK